MTVISRSQTWDLLILSPTSPKSVIPQTLTPLVLEHMVRKALRPTSSNVTNGYEGAPETFRSHVDTESTPLQITKAVDLWSIGCVFSEVSVWAHHGWKRVDEYRLRRSSEIEAKGGEPGEYVFHFGGNLLDAVNNIHQDMKGKTEVKDLMTRWVVDRLVVDLLQHEARPDALFVFSKSKRLVKECANTFGAPVPDPGGVSNSELVDSNETRTRNGSPKNDPRDHHRSHSGRDPPDDDFIPSSSSSGSQSSSHRQHHKSASHSSKHPSNGAVDTPQPGGKDPNRVPNSTSSPPIAPNTGQISPQHPIQERPTLTIDKGHAWKQAKKDGSLVVLPGSENLTSLDERDHVSQILFTMKLANAWL